jgi:hypothetical protein
MFGLIGLFVIVLVSFIGKEMMEEGAWEGALFDVGTEALPRFTLLVYL